MSLGYHRGNLLFWLQTDDCFSSVSNYGETMRLIKQWWEAYKSWERNDTFLKAFRDERLSVTQRPWVAKEVPGKTMDLIATSQKDPRGAKISHGRNLHYDSSVSGFQNRLKPENFKRIGNDGPHQVRRMKYELGLHDISASLLDPAKPTITEQLRWKPEAMGKGLDWAVVFMPLPEVEDLATLELLKYLAKPLKDKAPTVYRAVSFMKNRMTRVKFAQETDMGAGFLETGSAEDPHLRYGATDFQTEKRGTLSVPVYMAGISQVRRSKAREYKMILAKQRELGSLSNEIVVAYRQNASPRFPIIGMPMDAGAWYEVQGEQQPYYGKSTIPNDWRKTVELGA
jgi:hypothetical protein